MTSSLEPTRTLTGATSLPTNHLPSEVCDPTFFRSISLSSLNDPKNGKYCGVAGINGRIPPNLQSCCGNNRTISDDAGCHWYCEYGSSMDDLIKCVYGDEGENATYHAGFCQGPPKDNAGVVGKGGKGTVGLLVVL